MPTLDYGAAFLETGVNNVKAHSWDDVLVPFQKVRTLLNTTGIDTSNIQANGIRPADLRANTGLLGVRTQVYNDTGSSIAAGSLVYMKDSATVGSETFPKIVKAITTTSMSTTYFAQAIVEADIADNTAGTVSLFSQVASLNTSAGAVGDPVYLNTSAGGWTLTRPTGGNLVQVVGVIVEDHASTGKINFFLASFPDKNPTDTLSELGDTNITSAADASMLLYDTGTSKWIDNVMSGDATMADTGAVTLAGTNTNLTSLANLVTVGTVGTGTWAATDVAVSHGGTGASSAGSARTNLGLAIGSNVQAYDAGLNSISGLTTAANKMVYTSGSDTYAVADLSVFARTILDDADAGAVRTTIGAQASGSYQTSDAGLTSIAGLTTAADKMIYTSGSDTYVVTALSAFARTILDDADAAAVRSTIGAGSSSASAFADLSDVGSTTATAGRLMVADGDSWESVAVSGDIALASSGAMTIQANSVALATDTTGNYVATVADAGNSHITVANSGAENAGVTLNITDNAVGIAQLAGIARGKIIVGDSGGNPALLAAGSDGHVLQINGSGDAVWGAAASSGHTIQEEGSGLTSRANLNFVGAGVTATDNGSDTTIVTVSATGASMPFIKSDGTTSDPIALTSAAVGESLVSDTSPQLGGNLDVNGQSIVSVSNGNILVTPHGTGHAKVTGLQVLGDTAAGDDAAIGYTAAEGLILTGQGSTNDVTIKNDADAEVLSVPTGTQQAIIGRGLSGAAASATAADLVVEGSGNTGISILCDGTTNASSVFFGDAAAADIGRILYQHNGNSMDFYTSSSLAMQIDGTGAITTPNNPAFMNRYGATNSNATGDDTWVTLIGNTEVYDRNSDHNASTGGFTAPVAGLYQMSVGIYLEGLLSTHTRCHISMTSTNSGGIRSGYINPWNMTAVHSWGNVFSYSYSLLMNLAAGDVVLAKVQVGGGTKVVDIQGSTNITNYFSGHLVG